jgi:flagellin FlaB
MELKKFTAFRNLAADQRGITGLETAIVLIAFVVVAAVFAFAVLSTGLLSSEKSKETVLGGLEETSSTMTVRGDIVGTSDSTKLWINTIKFTLTSAAQASDAVDISSTGAVVTYLDSEQALNCTKGGGGSGSRCGWSTNWIIGTSDLLDPGEQVELTVDIEQMTPVLRKSTEFTIQVKPNKGAVVIVNKTTPAELKTVNIIQ